MEKLKTKYKTQDDVPSEYAALYEEKDGTWILTGIEGANDADGLARVAKQRDKEKARAEAAEAKLKTFAKLGDKDPEELLALVDQVDDLKAQLEAGGGKGDGKGPTEDVIQARITAKVKSETARLQRELDAARSEATTHKTTAEQLTGQMKRSKLETELHKAGAAAKLRQGALDDLMRYADVFEVGDDGKIVTKENAGYPPGLEVDVWLSDRKADRAHWWEPAVGGGAKGANGGGGVNGDNPFSKTAPNLTKAGQLMQSDPGKAAQFAKAAGFADVNAAVKHMSTAVANPGAKQG